MPELNSKIPNISTNLGDVSIPELKLGKETPTDNTISSLGLGLGLQTTQNELTKSSLLLKGLEGLSKDQRIHALLPPEQQKALLERQKYEETLVKTEKLRQAQMNFDPTNRDSINALAAAQSALTPDKSSEYTSAQAKSQALVQIGEIQKFMNLSSSGRIKEAYDYILKTKGEEAANNFAKLYNYGNDIEGGNKLLGLQIASLPGGPEYLKLQTETQKVGAETEVFRQTNFLKTWPDVVATAIENVGRGGTGISAITAALKNAPDSMKPLVQNVLEQLNATDPKDQKARASILRASSSELRESIAKIAESNAKALGRTDTPPTATSAGYSTTNILENGDVVGHRNTGVSEGQQLFQGQNQQGQNPQVPSQVPNQQGQNPQVPSVELLQNGGYANTDKPPIGLQTGTAGTDKDGNATITHFVYNKSTGRFDPVQTGVRAGSGTDAQVALDVANQLGLSLVTDKNGSKLTNFGKSNSLLDAISNSTNGFVESYISKYQSAVGEQPLSAINNQKAISIVDSIESSVKSIPQLASSLARLRSVLVSDQSSKVDKINAYEEFQKSLEQSYPKPGKGSTPSSNNNQGPNVSDIVRESEHNGFHYIYLKDGRVLKKKVGGNNGK